MYYKINELNILNRKLTKDSDYLTEKEYKTIKEKFEFDSNYSKLDKITNTYVVPKIKHKKGETSYCIHMIKLLDTSYYDANGHNWIKFYIKYLDENNEVTRADVIEEKGFKKEYIEHVNTLLEYIYTTTDYLSKKNERFSYYSCGVNVYSFNESYIEFRKQLKKEQSKLKDLLDYYKDNLVKIEEDKDYLNDINNIDDFLASLYN